ncbi:glycosyl transferase [Thermococcus siculi]|uniref:Glycosyl transferase n=1 Tax=Thermococcus siculi TaxID=72803 RepID=A0A2Z2ML23_9EURY|nr:glycosyltransferase family 4 protein [Thermococcus siculi]ASJ08345.1 glycosyl transferase [Thermococcus siculi]
MGRVLVVSPYFYPEGGGLERYAFSMAKKLSEEHDVEVLCMTRGEERVDEIEGMRVYRIKPALIVSNTPLSIKFVLKTAKMVKNRDLVIAHTPVPFAADVAALFAKLRGLPIRIVYHTVGLEKGAGLLDLIARIYSATVERLTLRGAEITAVSHVVWEYLKGRGYNSEVSYPPMNLDIGLSESTSRGKVILFVGQLGRYHRFKNVGMLIRAFAGVAPLFPDWELWIVGEGDMKKDYAHLTSRLGVSERVRFLGRVDDPKRLAEVYSSAGILVLPSAFESFGMVIPEALRLGTPVVVSPSVGARVLVSDGKNGLVLGGLSPEALATALELLLGNQKLLRKMGRIAASSAASYASL